MGIDHKVVEEKLPGIVDYADIGEFIDAPIKTYSSGHAGPPGLLDRDVRRARHPAARRGAVHGRRGVPREVQAARAASLCTEAKAIVLVTHDMNWVTEYCNRAMLIEQGRVILEGDPLRGRRAPPGAVGGAEGREGGQGIFLWAMSPPRQAAAETLRARLPA